MCLAGPGGAGRGESRGATWHVNIRFFSLFLTFFPVHVNKVCLGNDRRWTGKLTDIVTGRDPLGSSVYTLDKRC